MRPWLLILLLLSVAEPIHAHSGAAAGSEKAESIFKLEQLSQRTWALFGRGGNVGFLVTDAGVLVVDDQYEDIAAGIIEQIRTVTDKPIRYLVNTHFHGDHTGGNPVFSGLAEIIAHHTVRPRLLEYPLQMKRDLPAEIRRLEGEVGRLQDEDDPYRTALSKDLDLLRHFLDEAGKFDPTATAPPRITYEKEIRIWLDGQEVVMFHVGPGHTDGDTVVYFKNEKVLHMGDVFFHGMYPFIDTRGGGSYSGMIATLDQALARVAPDAKVIPGHGPITDMPTLRRYRQFLIDLQSEVRKAVDRGASLAEAIRSIEMPMYPEIKPLFRTLGHEVGAAYEEMQPGR